MPDTKPYFLAEDAVLELRSLVERGTSELHAPIVGTESLVNDIYTGRDPGGEMTSFAGVRLPFSGLQVDGDSTRTWRPPETTANLFLSRLRQITTTIAPGKPSFHVRARVAGAARLAEDQNKISDFVAQHGCLKEAMRRAGFLGLLSTHFGVKFVIKPADESAGDWDRFKYMALGPRECGFDPRDKRAVWHTYFKSWGDLPEGWQPKEKQPDDWKPWNRVRVTEVYHEGFRFGHKQARDFAAVPMSVFVAFESDDSSEAKADTRARLEGAFDLGSYVGTWNKPDSPLHITSMLEPAPGEDVAPAEVLSWIPLMRRIVQTLVQIDREVRTINNIVLYQKGAFTDEDIDYLRSAIPSERVFIGVNDEGVDSRMRPVEQSTYLNELLATLHQYLALFDDVTGVGPMDRGVPMNPRKSATEAQSITANSNKRNRDRLEVMAGLWSTVLSAQFKYQREVFGKALDIPDKRGIVNRVDVPDPKTAQFAFEVDPVDLGHLSKQGDAETTFNATQLLSNVFATYQAAIPKPVREMVRRSLITMGISDADILIDLPILDEGPVDRLQEFLLNGTPIAVNEQDQHQAYVAYYSTVVEKLAAQGHPAADEVMQAIGEHNVFIRRAAAANINAAAQPNVMPGFGPDGADNAIKPSLDLNEAPPFTLTSGR